MANALNRIGIDFGTTLTLTEDEARALEALVGYGDKKFLEFFYGTLGKSYMEPHEEGLLSFFKAVREQIQPALGQMNMVKNLIRDEILNKKKEA